ncbi:hypothetical protein DW971_02350 [Veillonella parvula]|nr:hypothetical protein DW971_02350 [Veillonella parvula]
MITEYNIDILQNEDIVIEFNIDQPLISDDLFACVRKYPSEQNYLAAFEINVDTKEQSATVNLKASSEHLSVGKHYYDVWIWVNNKPKKCILKGVINVGEGVSNRGKL